MAANATAKVTVKLLDQLTAPANIVRNSLRGIRGDMQSLSNARFGLTRQIDVAANRARELRSTLLGIGTGGLIAGYGMARVMKPATDFETTLINIRQKAELSTEATKALGDQIKALAPTVNKSAGDVAGAVDFMMGMGGISQENIMKMMPTIGKAASAYRAEITDMAKTSHSTFLNLKIPIHETAKALDIMARSGKEGGFEFKAMAQYLPAIFAMASNAKMTGIKGLADITAAAQVIRINAGDESDAATYLRNVLQKIESPETRKKFRKVGIDISKEIETGQKKGVSPLETLALQSQKALGKKGVKIGDLFEDQQVQIGVLALIQHLERFREISKVSLAAQGDVEGDFKIRMESFQSVIDRVSAGFEKLAVSLGEALIPNLTMLANNLLPALEGLAGWVNANQQLASGAVALGAGLIAVAAAAKLAALTLVGFRIMALAGGRGMLNLLAPKGTAPGAAAGAGARAAPTVPGIPRGASVPAVSPPSAFQPATAPRLMTPAEVAGAKGGANGLNPSGSRIGAGLRGGVAGSVALYLGETLIDSALDRLPKPKMPEGYDPKAEANLGLIGRLERLWNSIPAAPTPPAGAARPLDAGDMERSRRAQDEFKRDPEGTRGRAMMDLNKRTEGAAAGQTFSEGAADGIRSGAAGMLSAFNQALEQLRAEAAKGVFVPIRPRLEGGGMSLRSLNADYGVAP